MVRRRVLVTDAETPAALAVTRSLGRAGHRVAVLAAHPHAAAAASRYARAVIRTPDPTREADRFVTAVRRVRADHLIAVTDTAALLLGGADERLFEKRHVLDRAAALGIPVPERFERADLDRATFPCVVKPGRSRVRHGNRVLAATAEVAGDAAALASAFDRLAKDGFDPYVEPWLPGSGRGVFLLRHEGEVLARFAHRRVREASPLGGPSAVAEAVPLDPDLGAAAEALAADLGVAGPMMAEFRGDVLLEVNARYWGSLQLAVDAGVDFPALHLLALSGEPRPGPGTWREGVRIRNLAFDLRYLAGALRGRPRGLAIPWPGRGSAVCSVLRERAGGMISKSGDPAPARAHALHLARKAVNRG